MQKEKWKVIKEFNKYYVSSLGRVASTHNSKITILSATDNGNGYLRLNLYKNKQRYKVFVHRLVATAFHVNPKPLIFTHVHHIDHDKTNNNENNVKWTSPKLNCYYRDIFYKKRKQ